MAVEFDPSWEYYTRDEDLWDGDEAEAPEGFSGIPYSHPSNRSFRFGRGNPDHLRFALAPAKPERRVRGVVYRLCEGCGGRFEVGYSARGKFCSRVCYVEAARNPVQEKACVACGRPFQTRKPSRRCCSFDCTIKVCLAARQVSVAELKRRAVDPRFLPACGGCGLSFFPKRPEQKYCNRKCSGLAKHRSLPPPAAGAERPCPECGTDLGPPAKKAGRKKEYCGPKCRKNFTARLRYQASTNHRSPTVTEDQGKSGAKIVVEFTVMGPAGWSAPFRYESAEELITHFLPMCSHAFLHRLQMSGIRQVQAEKRGVTKTPQDGPPPAG